MNSGTDRSMAYKDTVALHYRVLERIRSVRRKPELARICRDKLPVDLPNARVLVYGYDT